MNKNLIPLVNPDPFSVRGGLLTPEQPLAQYRWSSWPEYLKKPGQRRCWLRVDRLMGEWGIGQDNAAARRQLQQGMEQRRCEESNQQKTAWKEIRRGWCLGSQAFREELLELIGSHQGDQHHDPENKESDEQKAERLITTLLRQAGWNGHELKVRRKGDREKARMAARLRAETTMTWSWIAGRLDMGHWRTAANAARATSVNP